MSDWRIETDFLFISARNKYRDSRQHFKKHGFLQINPGSVIFSIKNEYALKFAIFE